MGNPYTSPETIVSNENIRVVELLVRYKYQLKVVNMLRAEGMDYPIALMKSNALLRLDCFKK